MSLSDYYTNKFAPPQSIKNGKKAEDTFSLMLSRQPGISILPSPVLFKYLMRRNIISMDKALSYIDKEIGIIREQKKQYADELMPVLYAFKETQEKAEHFIISNHKNHLYNALLNIIMDKYYHVDLGSVNKGKKKFSTYEIKAYKREYHDEPMLLLETTSVYGYLGWTKSCKADYYIFFVEHSDRTFFIKVKVIDIRKNIIDKFQEKGIVKADNRDSDVKMAAAHKKAVFGTGYVVTRIWNGESRQDKMFYYPVSKLKEAVGNNLQCFEVIDKGANKIELEEIVELIEA
jgi:hypothetical protein